MVASIFSISHNVFYPSQSKLKFLIHFLPNDKILDWFKLKTFVDNKINVTEKLKFVFGRVENIVGKGENAGYQHFLLFPQCFQMASYSGSLKVAIVWYTVKFFSSAFFEEKQWCITVALILVLSALLICEIFDIVWWMLFLYYEKVKLRVMRLTLYHTIRTSNDLEERDFRKHCGKRRKYS